MHLLHMKLHWSLCSPQPLVLTRFGPVRWQEPTDKVDAFITQHAVS